MHVLLGFFCSSRRRHTRLQGDWSSDVCSSDLTLVVQVDEHSIVNQVLFQGNKKIKDAQLSQAVQLKPRSAFSTAAMEADEIGRASCREREELARSAGTWKANAATETS